MKAKHKSSGAALIGRILKTPGGGRINLDIVRTKNGGHYAGLSDAQARGIRDKLDAIERRRGCVTPEIVEEEARTDGLLHPLFEWNTQAAALKFRIEQAQALITCILVRTEDAHGVQAWVRARWPVRQKTVEGEYQTAYRPVQEIMVESESIEDVKSRCVADVARSLNPYLSLAPVFGWTRGEISRVVEKRLGQPLPDPPSEAKVLDEEEVAEIRERYGNGESVASMANRFGVTERALRPFVARVVVRERKR